MIEFKQFIREERGSYLTINPATGAARKRRHHRDNVGVSNATNPSMKYAHRVVPQCHTAPVDSVAQYENLKKARKGTYIISHADAIKLLPQNVDMNRLLSSGVQIGTTGITIKKLPDNRYRMTK